MAEAPVPVRPSMSRSMSMPTVVAHESRPLVPQDALPVFSPTSTSTPESNDVGVTAEGETVPLAKAAAMAVDKGHHVVAVGGGSNPKDFGDEQVVLDEDDAIINEQFSRVQVVLNTPENNPVHAHVRRYVRSLHEPELEDYYFSSYPGVRFALANLYFKLRSFFVITITIMSVMNVGLAVGATVLCIQFGLYTDMPIAFISASIIFPISFGISFNFSRRETTVREVAVLKALCLAMFMGARDWPNTSEKQREAVAAIRDGFGILLTCIRQTMLHNTPPGGSVQVYKAFDDLHLRFGQLNNVDGAFHNSSMYSRLVQYLRQAMEAWEKIRVMHDYRTPSALRSFALIWLLLSSMLLSPLFAKYSKDYGYMSGIYAAIVVSLLLSGLHQILQNEEDPFDGAGIDDLSLDPLSLMTQYMYDKPKTVRTRVHVMEKKKKNATVWRKGKSQPALKPFKKLSGGKKTETEEDAELEEELAPNSGRRQPGENYVTKFVDQKIMDRLRTQNPMLTNKDQRAQFMFYGEEE